MTDSPITWTTDNVAGIPLRRALAHVGKIEVGDVSYDGSNRLWTWSSRLADDAWGHATTEGAARQGFESWLTRWVQNFAPFFQGGHGCASLDPAEDLSS